MEVICLTEWRWYHIPNQPWILRHVCSKINVKFGVWLDGVRQNFQPDLSTVNPSRNSIWCQHQRSLFKFLVPGWSLISSSHSRCGVTMRWAQLLLFPPPSCTCTCTCAGRGCFLGPRNPLVMGTRLQLLPSFPVHIFTLCIVSTIYWYVSLFWYWITTENVLFLFLILAHKSVKHFSQLPRLFAPEKMPACPV